jgi:hypothetical protein
MMFQASKHGDEEEEECGLQLQASNTFLFDFALVPKDPCNNTHKDKNQDQDQKKS